MKGSQTNKIKAIMREDYANMVQEDTTKRLTGLLLGGVGGLIAGRLTGQNPWITGLIGGVIGYVVTISK